MIHLALEEIPGHFVKSSEMPLFLKKQCTGLVLISSTYVQTFCSPTKGKVIQIEVKSGSPASLSLV
jgi:hypothetical protein